MISTTNYSDKLSRYAALIQQAYANIGIKVSVEYMPGERSIQFANQGKTDGELLRFDIVTQHYKFLRKVPVAIQVISIDAFGKRQLKVSDWKSLKPYLIGYVRGHKIIERQLEGYKTSPVTNITQAYSQLDKGWVDIVLHNSIQSMQIIQQMNLQDRIHRLAVIVEQPLYHFVHQKHEHLIPKLTEQFTQMKEAGAFANIK